MNSRLIAMLVGALLLLPLALVWPVSSAPAPGSLDPSFGTDGVARTTFSSSPARGATIYGVAIQADGKIVVAGNYHYNGPYPNYERYFVLARYRTDGTLDSSFGGNGNGTAATRIGYHPDYRTSDYGGWIAIQTDGKIVLAGQAYEPGASSFVGIALARYTTAGLLDSSFGPNGNGTLIFKVPGASYSTASAVAIQPSDGKIVVVGSGSFPLAGLQFVVARFTTLGMLDLSFGGGGTGVVTTTIGWSYSGSSYSSAAAVGIQTDGKIVVVGYAPQNYSTVFAIARYTSSGALDPAFGGNSNGTALTAFSDYYSSSALPSAVAIQPDGKIVVEGTYYGGGGTQALAFTRYASDGTLDFSFGTSGIAIISAISYGIANLVIQSDGKVLTAGTVHVGTSNRVALTRLLSNGTSDTTFGSAGTVVSPSGPGSIAVSNVVSQTDGKIVAAGTFLSGTSSGFAVARFIMADASAPVWTGGGTLAASNIGSTGVTLSWTPATDDVSVANYRIYQGSTLLATLAGNVYSYTVTGLSPGTSYTFTVQAGDAAGNWSAVASSLTVSTTGGFSLLPWLLLIGVIAGFAVALLLTKMKQPKIAAPTAG